MKIGAGCAAMLVLSTFARAGWACACGVPGLESALTSQQDRWGTRLLQSLTLGHGRWNAFGQYRPLATSEHDQRYQLEALAAMRVLRRWELSASTSYVRTSTSDTGTTSTASGAGDSFVGARYEIAEEAPPYRAGVPWPAVALNGSLRLPTANVNSTSQLGLGAYELAVGASLERSIKARFRVGASGTVSVRAPDDSLGATRQLGPRLTGQIAAWYWPNPNLALNVASNVNWEDSVVYAGDRQAGSGSRQWQLGTGVSLRPAGSGLRSSLRVRYAPPLPGVGVNALGDTMIDLSLAYVR